jgi:hypothetical protein
MWNSAEKYKPDAGRPVWAILSHGFAVCVRAEWDGSNWIVNGKPCGDVFAWRYPHPYEKI